MELTTFIWMFVVLKIPIVAALVLIWYAIREPEPVVDDGPEGGGSDRRPDPRTPRPRPPRRGPHGAPAPVPPPRTPHRRGRPAPQRALAFAPVNAFHVLGAILALWALTVSFLGVTRENWPGDKRTERAVATISVVLVLGAIGSAIVTSIMHDEEEHEDEEAALVLPG